jgi:hypothetical protein
MVNATGGRDQDYRQGEKMSTTYMSPVVQLLTYGDCRNLRKWPDYRDIGITEEHIPELIRMLTDDALNSAKGDSPEVWAPAHAWRALGQLKAVEALDSLLGMFAGIDKGDDCAGEELPYVMEMIGSPALPKLSEYLQDDNNGEFARVAAAHSISLVGKREGDSQKECIQILSSQLTKYRENDTSLNAFLISYLTDLEASESIELIREAFAHDRVDLIVMGDFEDVEIEMGLKEKRTTERPRLSPFSPRMDEVLPPMNKIGRNEPCPCGSGKKYKKCCGR